MKRWVASGGTFLILFAFALPARAGLGELVEAVIEEPSSDLTASLEPVMVTGPVVEDPVETVEEVTAPLLADVDEGPAVTVVEEKPTVDVTDTAGAVLDAVAPVVTNPLPTPEVASPPTNPPPTNNAPVPMPLAPVVQATLAAPIEISSSQGVLLASISNAPLPPDDHQGDEAVDNQTPWLHALKGWLESGLSGLFDVLAIPARFLELLFRALISAGSGLVAPAAILAALAATSRRRLLPAS
jgi:hypothetical protein